MQRRRVVDDDPAAAGRDHARRAAAWRGSGWPPRATCRRAGPGRPGWSARPPPAEAPSAPGRPRSAPARDPVSASSASTPATRLDTFWKDCRAIRAFASRSFSPSAPSSLTAISGCSFSSRFRSPARIATACMSSSASTVAERTSPPNIASSPKISPGPEVRERDRAPVGVLARDAGAAALEDVARVAGVALAQHDACRPRSAAARRRARSCRAPAPDSPTNSGTARSNSAVRAPVAHWMANRWPFAGSITAQSAARAAWRSPSSAPRHARPAPATGAARRPASPRPPAAAAPRGRAAPGCRPV